ncbi:MAG: hypothetical protein R3C41_11715 [Calditrichia bacterium]|nr:hypothetical protein [Calditrichota bacterium]MCB0269387.1 hypothetical protein [Calditrichota bacterium]MCB0285217.1 hypothetical protein [Calditrichota bacterium]MCB9068562.1 hypothetical protein [Calditrichia bacterium]
MIVLLPVVFSVLLTIGMIVTIMIGTWFFRSNYFKASYITAGLLLIAAIILGNEALTFFMDLQDYTTANELFAGRVLAMSAAIPAIVAMVGGSILTVNAVYRQWSYRQLMQSRLRDMVEA